MKPVLRWLLLCSALGAFACNTALRVDPEGLRCDPGNVCPAGFDCSAANVCRARGGTDGGDVCANVLCNTPPASQCQDANTKRSFTAGACDKSTGQCVWTAQDVNCGAAGCAAGVCVGDPCNTVTCNTPPAATCLNGTTLRAFAAVGTCANGTCSYANTDTTCTNGCANGACVGQNLCVGVTCATPPAPTCSGANRITYGSPGTCNTGTGQCSSYPQTSTACPTGCTAGSCNALNFTQTYPQVRHRVDSVDQGTGSFGDRVLAVGPGGAVSYFNGIAWAKVVVSGTLQDLNAVWFSGSNSAWLVGKNRAVYRWNGTTLAAVTGVPGSGSANFIGVHGVSDTDVVIADEVGGWYRFKAGTWTSGALSSTNQPYAMRAVYVDGLGKTRIVGRCSTGTATAKGCLGYNDPLSASNPNTWYEDLDNSATTTDGFLSVGRPVTSTTEAWVGRSPTNVIRRHLITGTYDSTSVPVLPSTGVGVVGITGNGVGATFILSGGDTTTPSYLYRATATGLDAAPLLDNYFNATTMSKNESGGVIVADANKTANVNNIFRRGPVTYEALDLGEDWVGFDVGSFVVPPNITATQAVVVVSAYNDLALRASNGTRWYFRRGPFAEATDLVAGTDFAFITARAGKLYRFSIANQFQAVTSGVAQDFNAACRATNTELYAVGNGGAVVSYSTGTTATPMNSGVVKNLLDVHCPTAGSAVACGQDGTVLQLRSGAWSAISPAFPNAAAQLTSCRLMGNAIYVAGDGVFAKFEAGVWTTLANRTPLSDLIALSPNDIYATSGTDVVRFDGTAWTSKFISPATLRAGGQLGARVVYAGNSGVVVEGQ